MMLLVQSVMILVCFSAMFESAW